jgi:hypothetical protein
MSSNDIFKQLAINSLINSKDLQEEVKSFIFYDRKEAEAKRNKQGLINQLKLGLRYYPDNQGGHWALNFRYERQLQAINCICCGQYHIANNQDFTTLPARLLCNCDENYVEEIMQYIDWMEFNLEESDQESYISSYDQEDEEIDDIVTIDYGISWLLN